ncbi:alpha/beta fold hydrolase [bacterium]|nr:MAG: alpha/beta fold hydrolase [bacterium]
MAVWVLGLLLWACVPARAEKVAFKAADGVALAAEWRAPRRGQPVFVLLHGLGAGRGEWRTFQARAAAAGWGTLAVDMRGHGESGGPRYDTFRTPAAWLALEADARAAMDWLAKSRHVAPERVALAGASLGANIAARTAVDEPRSPLLVLLSPGWSYQGVTLPDAVAACGRPIVFAAAAEDAYAFKSAQEALRLAKRPESVFLRAAHGHGVGMLDGDANKAFADDLFRRLAELLTPPSPGK